MKQKTFLNMSLLKKNIAANFSGNIWQAVMGLALVPLICQIYAALTSVGSYCVVFDTGVEDLPDNMCSNRPWGKGNNPKTAVYEYLKSTDCFEIDKTIEHKLLITAAPDGYLRRIK